ncbi:MAG: hypothetical protein RRA15_13475 [bacterium]|nr:hypothetical protein [bacterium]MDT8367469.1 hypothetical protein [bacterium]
MNPVFRIATALVIPLLLLPVFGRAGQRGADIQWRAIQLPATGQWYEGQGFNRADTPLDRSGPLGNGYNTIYLVDLEPGLDYTLGLRYRADAGKELSAELFDRWPYDPEARSYKLPLGPVVRTDPDWIEYRWRVGVSDRSRGNLAFVAVQARPRGAGPTSRFRHFMYLTTPAVRPMNHVGTGITYLRGPSDLFLPQTTDQVQYVVEYPYDARGPDNGPGTDWRPGGGLIFNGDFSQGLQGWDLFSEGEDGDAVDHVASGKDGLRIWSDSKALRSGVKQVIQREVRDAGSLVLEMELRIDKDPGGLSQTDAGAIELSICYLDSEGKDHCGDEAYRTRFTTHRQSSPADGVVQITIGKWFFFESELMDLTPGPQVIKSVSVAGGQSPGQDAWIRQIHLIEGGRTNGTVDKAIRRVP